MEAAGFNSLMAKLKGLEALAQRRLLIGAARKAMVPVLEDAMALAPKDTGLLALSAIQLKGETKTSGSESVGAAGITFAGPHRHIWHFSEFGTSKMAARPFLRPAMRRNAAKVVELFRAEMKLAIERALKRQQAQSFTGKAKVAAARIKRKASKVGKRAKRSLKRLSKQLGRRRGKRGAR